MLPIKDLFLGYIKNSLHIKMRKHTNRIKQANKTCSKCAKDLLHTSFSKENVKMVNKHMRICYVFWPLEKFKLKSQWDITTEVPECHNKNKILMVLNGVRMQTYQGLTCCWSECKMKWQTDSGNLVCSYLKT